MIEVVQKTQRILKGIQREIRCSHLLCVRVLRHGKEQSHPEKKKWFTLNTLFIRF